MDIEYTHSGSRQRRNRFRRQFFFYKCLVDNVHNCVWILKALGSTVLAGRLSLCHTVLVLVTVSVIEFTVMLCFQSIHQLPLVGISFLCLPTLEEAVRHVCHLYTRCSL